MAALQRKDSSASQDSQTAAEFLDEQLRLEAEAREVLPYKFDTCTKDLGALRQLLFACLTCNPPDSKTYQPAAVCYSCSVSCHGDHDLVELFHKRNFTCDCGSTKFPSTSPCTLRINAVTGEKRVSGEAPEAMNQYNHNFMNRFCGCGCDYEAEKQPGTMFQCLGLEGGCGEDWWHPTCVVGLDYAWYEGRKKELEAEKAAKKAESEAQKGTPQLGDAPAQPTEPPQEDEDDEDELVPPGFPKEDDFEHFICYKCVDANPWIKRYAGTEGFLPPVFKRSNAPSPEVKTEVKEESAATVLSIPAIPEAPTSSISLKRRAEDDAMEVTSVKRVKDSPEAATASVPTPCTWAALPSPPQEPLSLFLTPSFRNSLCRCSSCFPLLARHPPLLDEEPTYSPPVSEGSIAGESSLGTGSLLDRGERALSTMDRVKAIEGVMAFNHLKEKLTPFFKKFAESGEVVSAEDVKNYFAQMRGDETGVKNEEEGEAVVSDGRKEQGGY